MRRRQRATISELRQAVECLPKTTKIAMLEGIRANEIIAGAYTDGSGVCPMLAAHRAGGRTSLISFARAWDRFAFRGARVAFPGTRAGRTRRATERELLVLKTHLEASLLEDDAPNAELARAMAEHRARAREIATAAGSSAAATGGRGCACSAATTTTSAPSTGWPTSARR
jgi:hypothetical protein